VSKLSNGNYQVQKLIATGGTAVLYRALQTSLDRAVAIKKLHAHLTEDENFTRRFILEAKAAASLDHDNIVNIIDFGNEDGVYYMVMEYIEGESLREILDKWKQVPLSLALTVTHQVCQGLEHAHSKGIVHRDIKPGNIMLTRTGRVKITDFGLAKLSDTTTHHTAADSILGTPLYMSPEQAVGERVDHRSDLFSLGTMLYEMITGVQPFNDDNYMGVIQNIINRNAPHPSRFDIEIPQPVQALLSKAMNKSRDGRFQNAADFRHAIEKAMGLEELKNSTENLRTLLRIEGETVILPRTQRVLQRKSRIRKGLVATLVATALLGAAGTTYTLAPDLVTQQLQATVAWVGDRVQRERVAETADPAHPLLTPALTDSIVTRILARMDSTRSASPPETAADSTAAAPRQPAEDVADTRPAEPTAEPATRQEMAKVEQEQRVQPRKVIGAAVSEPEMELEEKPPPVVRKGWLYVMTESPAEIYVDGTYRGDSPPEVRIELVAGTHRLECKSANYKPYEETLRITADELSTRSIKLDPKMGRVSLTATEGAEVYVDGTFVGTTPLRKPIKLGAGGHRLTIKKVGYNAWDNDITVDAERTLPLKIVLSPSY